jgi:hypothetical protein
VLLRYPLAGSARGCGICRGGLSLGFFPTYDDVGPAWVGFSAAHGILFRKRLRIIIWRHAGSPQNDVPEAYCFDNLRQ